MYDERNRVNVDTEIENPFFKQNSDLRNVKPTRGKQVSILGVFHPEDSTPTVTKGPYIWWYKVPDCQRILNSRLY